MPSLSKPPDKHDNGALPAASPRAIFVCLSAVRFPILTGLILFSLPILQSSIVGLLVLSRWEIVLVTMLALLVAWCCGFSATVLAEAWQCRLSTPAIGVPAWLFRRAFLWSPALAIPIIASLLSGADD